MPQRPGVRADLKPVCNWRLSRQHSAAWPTGTLRFTETWKIYRSFVRQAGGQAATACYRRLIVAVTPSTSSASHGAAPCRPSFARSLVADLWIWLTLDNTRVSVRARVCVWVFYAARCLQEHKKPSSISTCRSTQPFNLSRRVLVHEQ